jgi:hypothetical protein
MNNKGLTNSLVAVTIVLFTFALLFIFARAVWTPFNTQIQNLDSSIADNITKDKIDDLGIYLTWGDKLFTIFLVVLLVAYLVTSFTLPAQNSWMFLLFIGFLVLITFLAMVLSNSWTYMLSDPVFSAYSGDVPVTDYVLRHFPVFIFLVGIVGGVIFYSRSNEGGSGGSITDSSMGGQEF